MRDDFQKFQEQKATIVVVTRHDTAAMRKYWKKENLPFVGIADPAGQVTTRFGQQWKLFSLGRMPAQFVVNCEGEITLAHYGSGMSDILPTPGILKKLVPCEKPANQDQ